MAESKRGRPKGSSKDTKSYGPLGDLIRTYRIQNKMGLLEVAKACKCSVQFISNIEHGRAPLPWEKAEQLAKALKIPYGELQASNLATRSDFQSFMVSSGAGSSAKGRKLKKSATALSGLMDAASLVALTAQDKQLQEILQSYYSASESNRRRFYAKAKQLLS